MKTPPIVYGIISLCILLVVIFFLSHNSAVAPIVENPRISTSTPEIPSNTQTIHPYGLANAGLSEKIVFTDFSLIPIKVIQDNRCPFDVQCITAGTVSLQIDIIKAKETISQTLEIGESIPFDEFTVTLKDVAPATKSTTTIQPSDYRFYFSVSKKNTVAENPVQGGCFIGGCSSEVCSDKPDVASTCIYHESYACYKTAKCERQQNGQCGWTASKELSMCLDTANKPQAM